jgi:bla regulator protein blaR1
MIDLSAILDAWAIALGRTCWQGSLVVLTVWTICRLFPSMPARFQCWFWRLAVLKFLMVLLVPWHLDLPLLHDRVSTVAESETATLLASDSSAILLDQSQRNPGPLKRFLLFEAIARSVWLIGVVWFVARLWTGWLGARRVLKQGRVIACPLMNEQLKAQRTAFGLRALPRLVEVEGDGSPMLVGILCPVIVIPAGTLRRLSASERAIALGHELAHIRRGDLFWGLVASLVRAVFFFHPLVWLTERRLKLAQEVAADELVVMRQHHDPIGYGKVLVSIVGKLGPRPPVPAISVETAGPAHSLTRRLVAMAYFGRTSRRVTIGSGILVGTVVLLGLVPWQLATAAPWAERDTIEMEVLAHGKQVAAINKSTGERRLLSLPGDARVTEALANCDRLAACVVHGPLLVVFNGHTGQWATFRIAMGNPPLDIRPIIGDHVVCYELKDRVIAYSAIKSQWGVLVTNASAAVGDEAIRVETATEFLLRKVS